MLMILILFIFAFLNYCGLPVFSRFQPSVPSCANFLCTFACIALPNTVTKLCNQILIYDVTGVAC